MNATPTTLTAEDLGEAVGKIAAFAALSLHESYPHLKLDELVETFTRESATTFLTKRLLAGLHGGQTPAKQPARPVSPSSGHGPTPASPPAPNSTSRPPPPPEPAPARRPSGRTPPTRQGDPCPPARPPPGRLPRPEPRPLRLLRLPQRPPRRPPHQRRHLLLRRVRLPGDRGDCVADLDAHEKSFTA
ncbi:hypothetical protein ACR6C2_08060 [Streptomyces sp. INA 01156]